MKRKRKRKCRDTKEPLSSLEYIILMALISSLSAPKHNEEDENDLIEFLNKSDQKREELKNFESLIK